MDCPAVSVVVPTFREAANLPLLVPRIARALESAGLDGEIIIVDDNSPDGTVAVCAALAESHPVRLLVRTDERGLSSAVVHGIRHAKGDTIVVMDADLSHPPEKVSELLMALNEDGVDFVIGSRYAAGGAVADDWGLFRWLNSKVATLLCRPLTSAADPMAGFFAFRRSLLQKSAQLDPIGYKIGLELIVKGGCRHVAEVPITFQDRMHGTSKLTLREQINYIRHLRRLYAFKLGAAAGPLQFALVGLTGMAVDLATLALVLLVMPFPAARATAIWAALSWNFYLNRRMTFAHARTGNMGWQYALYALSCSIGAAVSWTMSMFLAYELPFFADHPLLAAAAGVFAGAAVNYVGCSVAVFRTPRRRRTDHPSATHVAAFRYRDLPDGMSDRVVAESLLAARGTDCPRESRS
ncbi:MAG: glycosyltransferase family 2 protein [Gemmataceae bacterium]|nr:glycosyltransferase family 2 protein [Gemmataceae bacterium]